jgi:ferrous iron transport protein A
MPKSRPTSAGTKINGNGEPLIPLGRLSAGQSAVIGRIEGRSEDVHRLEEFGLRGGTAVEMFRPGNPCILRLAGNKVCLRLHGSLAVLVAPLCIPH